MTMLAITEICNGCNQAVPYRLMGYINDDEKLCLWCRRRTTAQNSQPMTITLRQQDGIWVGEHTGPGSDEVVELFGTNTLPTPFTANMLGTVVQDAIRKLNPEHLVVLA